MKKLIIIAIAVLFYPCWMVVRDRYFLAAPHVALSDFSATVGDPNRDQTIYKVGAPTEIHETVVDYGFNSFGLDGAIYAKLGGRAMLAYMQNNIYTQMISIQENAGTSTAVLLTQNEQNGTISHLILIPQSAEAMNQLRLASLPQGAHFHLTGRPLTFKESKVTNTPGGANIVAAHYFLVDSLSRDK